MKPHKGLHFIASKTKSIDQDENASAGIHFPTDQAGNENSDAQKRSS